MTTFDFSTTKGSGTAVTLTGLNFAPYDSVEVQFSSTSAYNDDLIGRKGFTWFPGSTNPIVLTLSGTEVDTIQDCHFRVNGLKTVNGSLTTSYAIMTGSIAYTAIAAPSGSGGGLSEADVNSLIQDYAVAHPSAVAPKDYATGYLIGATKVNVYNHFVNSDITDDVNPVVVPVTWNSSTIFDDTNYHMRMVMNNGSEQDFDLSLGTPQQSTALSYLFVNITDVWPTGARVELYADTASKNANQFLKAGNLIQFIAVG